MSQGGVSGSIVPGGGGGVANGQQQARQVAVLGVSPGGTLNTIFQPGNQPAARALCGSGGPLVEEAALLLAVPGAPPPLLVPLNPATDGAVSAVTADGANAGTGTLALSVAPHVPVKFKVTTGGIIGTMAGRFSLDGGATYGAVVTSSDSGAGAWVYRVPGTFCTMTFPAGTYVVLSTVAVGVDGTVTPGGTDAAGSVTSSAGPFDIAPAEHFDVSIDEGGSQVWTFSGTQGYRLGSAGDFDAGGGSLNGTTLALKINGGPTQTVTFTTAEVDAATTEAKINASIIGGFATVVGGQIKIFSDRYGTSSTINITSANAHAGFSSTGLGTAGTATCTKSGGTGTKTVTIAFLDAATAAEVAAAVVAADGVTGGALTAVSTTLHLVTSATGASPKGVQVKNTSTNSLGFDNTEHNGVTAGEITSVTQASSPLDSYELVITVAKGGALGAAALAISLDDGFSSAGTFQTPSSGAIVVTDGHGNGTGLVLTPSGTFAANDRYTALALPSAPLSAGVSDAITAMIASDTRPTVCNLHIQALPATAAAAFALAQAVDTALATAFASGLDWQAFIECPTVGDVVLSGGVPILDTADTDAVIRSARAGVTTNRVAVHASTGGIVSPLTAVRVRRPFGWATAQRYLATDPANSLGRPADGPLNFAIGRDEKLAAIQLGDVQINVPTTYDGKDGAFLNITSGGFALKNLTLSTLYQDAEQLRALNVVSATVRVVGLTVLADRPPVNASNTIAESAARDYDTLFDTAVKKSVGLLVGGAFGTTPQVSSATASILRSSVLGASPRRLDISVPFKGLGMVSAVSYVISVLGA